MNVTLHTVQDERFVLIMVKCTPLKITKVTKSTSSMSRSDRSQERRSSQDITREDDESAIKEEFSDEFDIPGAEPKYDALLASTFVVLRFSDVEKRSFPRKYSNTETKDVCNVYAIDSLGAKRVFICWKGKAHQIHDYIT